MSLWAQSLNVHSKDTAQCIDNISSLPFLSNKNNRIILEALNLDISYLPDKAISSDELGQEKILAKNKFFELLDYQFDIKMRVLKIFKTTQLARCMIHMPTGSGKTKTAMNILHNYWWQEHDCNGIIVWMAHSEELLKQAIDAFKDMWEVMGRKDVDLIRLWGNFNLPQELPVRGIIFTGIQKMISISKKNQIDELNKHLRMVVIDEAHKAPAKETKKVIYEMMKMPENSQNRVLLGLTATPGRSTGFDKQDEILISMFENSKVDLNIKHMDKYLTDGYTSKNVIDHLQHRKILSKFEREPIQIERKLLNLSPADILNLEKSIKDKSSEIKASTLDKIAKSKARNQLIIEKLIDLNSQGLKTLVFACNLNHVRLLTAALQMRGVNAEHVLGDTPSNHRADVISKFKDDHSGLNILINYGVLTTGFDSPNIDCIFIARPVTSVILYSQMIGRGIRGTMMGGKSSCILIDVVDNIKQHGDESWAFSFFNKYWS